MDSYTGRGNVKKCTPTLRALQMNLLGSTPSSCEYEEDLNENEVWGDVNYPPRQALATIECDSEDDDKEITTESRVGKGEGNFGIMTTEVNNVCRGGAASPPEAEGSDFLDPGVLRGNVSIQGTSRIMEFRGRNKSSHMPTPSQAIPRAANAYDAIRPIRRASAPLMVPDWKILPKTQFDSEVEDSNEVMVPPHLLVAQDYSRSVMASSVYEGVGRTLKGRDLSHVRTAILRQTGFLD